MKMQYTSSYEDTVPNIYAIYDELILANGMCLNTENKLQRQAYVILQSALKMKTNSAVVITYQRNTQMEIVVFLRIEFGLIVIFKKNADFNIFEVTIFHKIALFSVFLYSWPPPPPLTQNPSYPDILLIDLLTINLCGNIYHLDNRNCQNV